MRVTVKFFASLKDELNLDGLELEVDGEGDRTALLSSLNTQLSSEQIEKLQNEEISIAINQTLQRDDFVLKQDDEVAFMPPITGG